MLKAMLMIIAFSVAGLADNKNLVTYEMKSFATDLWQPDVDYNSPPILLKRTHQTFAMHKIYFDVSRWESYCTHYESRCVHYDNQGRCLRWERVCRSWNYRDYPVQKVIELDLRYATELQDGESELFKLLIQRSKPHTDGEDYVSIWLDPEAVLQPVIIRRTGDYRYSIEVKK